MFSVVLCNVTSVDQTLKTQVIHSVANCVSEITEKDVPHFQ